jgi:hypothetical protein
MPLETGKSRAAFSHNVKTELAAKKPLKQAVAIAYREQKGDSALTRAADRLASGESISGRDRKKMQFRR